ncbi:glycerate kinase [Saccharothrix sp. S26]|uniref:glycerate kinase n=1 Tax=Saccharothrix sp. S26 TaxID=2907215 RepID=UPI0035AB7507
MPGARLVITGECSPDHQPAHGKAPAGVARAACRSWRWPAGARSTPTTWASTPPTRCWTSNPTSAAA